MDPGDSTHHKAGTSCETGFRANDHWIMGEMGLSARTVSRRVAVVEHLAHLSGRSEGMSPSTSEPVATNVE